jgi:hypothetical protein
MVIIIGWVNRFCGKYLVRNRVKDATSIVPHVAKNLP